MRRLELAERIIELREHAGLTQGEAAKRAGVGVTTWSNIETGTITRPHARTVIKIARALGVEPEELTAPKASAPQPSAKAAQLWREETEPILSDEEAKRRMRNLGEGIRHPEASGWINALNQIAGSVERTIARGDYSREEILDEEGNVVETYAVFRPRRKHLLETSPTRIQEDLRQAEARMKAARAAARAAYQARNEQALREAEREGNVARIKALDKVYQEREVLEPYADAGA
ncbi:MAG: helix-turn-helix domain-containing protein [Actinomycetota bacterium]|nr:helix-turn-helix domain-containing protein [Actinomycetota bacterium]